MESFFPGLLLKAISGSGRGNRVRCLSNVWFLYVEKIGFKLKNELIETFMKWFTTTFFQSAQEAIEAATGLQLKIENKILADNELHEQAKKGILFFY